MAACGVMWPKNLQPVYEVRGRTVHATVHATMLCQHDSVALTGLCLCEAQCSYTGMTLSST